MIDTKEQRQAIFGATLAWLKAGAPHGPNNIGFRMDYEVLDEVIAAAAEEESITDWDENDCGTACCMIGHVSLKARDTYDRLMTFMYAGIEAADDTASFIKAKTLWTLFYPPMDDVFRPETGLKSLYQVTPQMAATVLAHYIETGETKWSLVKA